MSKIKICIYAFVGLLLTVALTSCEDWLDVNTDPNNPVTLEPNFVLPVGQAYTAHYLSGSRRLNHLGSMMMANLSESHGFSWYNDEFRYNVTTTFYAPLFDQAYSRCLKQYQILDKLEGGRYSHYKAVGKIMKVYHFQILVDLYGDVPYFEALGRSENPSPKYDDAVEIYKDLLVQLNEAKALLSETPEDLMAIGDDDIMFKGNVTDWVKFSNSLKSRILARLSGPTATASGEFSALITEEMGKTSEGFISTDVLVNPSYVNQENKQNPLWEAFGKNVDGSDKQDWRATCATEYILTMLNSKSDPRIDYLYSRPIANPDAHKGWNQGLEATDDVAYNKVSLIGTGLLKGATAGLPIFTLAENDFNLAELALKGFGGDAEALYTDGIVASMKYLGVHDTTQVKYLHLADSLEMPLVYFPTTTPEAKLETIMFQKRIAVLGITAEQSWFDLTRTGYPTGVPLSAEATTPNRPVRLFYPASEQGANKINVPSQPNAFSSKIFWAN